MWQTAAYIPVWATPYTLWTHAVTRAPLKPRTNLNMGVALMRMGDGSTASVYFSRALAASQLPHVPEIDRMVTERRMPQ